MKTTKEKEKAVNSFFIVFLITVSTEFPLFWDLGTYYHKAFMFGFLIWVIVGSMGLSFLFYLIENLKKEEKENENEC